MKRALTITAVTINFFLVFLSGIMGFCIFKWADTIFQEVAGLQLLIIASILGLGGLVCLLLLKINKGVSEGVDRLWDMVDRLEKLNRH